MSKGESLTSVVRESYMPGVDTILGWVHFPEKYQSHGFDEHYAQARRAQSEYWGMMIAEVATDLLTGRRSDFALCRVAMDGLKWTAARLDPGRWGDTSNLQIDVRETHIKRIVLEDKRAPAMVVEAENSVLGSLETGENRTSGTENEGAPPGGHSLSADLVRVTDTEKAP
jgi:hypothetical protein